MLVPAFNAPDENAHFAYVQSLGEQFVLPGDPSHPIFSQQQFQGADAVNSDQVAGQKFVKPEWSRAVERDWKAGEADRPRDDGGGATAAAANPPAAYLWDSLGYRAAASGDLVRRGARRAASRA